MRRQFKFKHKIKQPHRTVQTVSLEMDSLAAVLEMARWDLKMQGAAAAYGKYKNIIIILTLQTVCLKQYRIMY